MRNTVSLARSLAFLEWHLTVAFSGCGNDAKLKPPIPAMCPEQEWPELNGTEKVHKQPVDLKTLGTSKSVALCL